MFKIGRLTTIAGSAVGIAVVIALLVLPIIQYCSTTFQEPGNGQAIESCGSATLIQSQGGQLEPVTWAYLAGMASASALAGWLGWRASRSSGNALPAGSWNAILIFLSGILLGLGMLVAGFSIGFCFAPAVLLVLLGAGALLIGCKG